MKYVLQVDMYCRSTCNVSGLVLFKHRICLTGRHVKYEDKFYRMT